MGEHPPLRCTRRAGPATVEAVRADSLKALLEGLAVHGMDDAAVMRVSDLSLGAWRGHQVATELLGQRDPADTGRTPLHRAPGWVPANIGFWIDAETRGDTTRLRALQMTETIQKAVAGGPACTFLVLAPRFDQSWGEDNTLFLHYLASCLDRHPHRLVLAFPGDARGTGLPERLFQIRWLDTPAVPETAGERGPMALIPGIIEPDVAAVLAEHDLVDELYCFVAPNGRLLIPPEARRSPASSPAGELRRLLPLVEEHGWMTSYLQYWLHDGRPDFGALISQAWYRLSEGSGEIAFRLMDRVLEAAFDDGMRASFEIQYQWMRIACHRFEEAAAVADPPAGLGDHGRGTLYWQKAWGLVMSGHPREARPRFETALELLSFPRDAVQRVYFLNVYALSLLRTGDCDAAMALEREIESLLATGEIHDWHMGYINNLNIARLLRRQGDLDGAERHYRRAFDATEGARNGIDGLYLNASMALLHETRQRWQEAFRCWLRSALHWVALDYPETIGRRVIEAIKAERRPDAELLGDPEAISVVLTDILAEAAQRAGVDVFPRAIDQADGGSPDPPVFVSDDALTTHAPPRGWEVAVGAAGWGLLASRESLAPSYEGPAHCRLRAILHALLVEACPAGALQRYRCFGLDDRGGTHIPRERGELLELALVHGLGRVVFGDRAEEMGGDPRESLVARLGPAVRAIDESADGAVVRFSRYFSPQPLDEVELGLVRRIADAPEALPLAGMALDPVPTRDPWRTLRSLSVRRIVALRLPSTD